MNKYKLKITGKSLKYFLDLIIKKKINIYYLEQGKDYLIIIVSLDDYKKIKKIKTLNKINILNRYGTPKFVYILDKYKYIIMSFVIIIMLLMFLSNVVFDIEVVHTKEEIRNIIFNDLEEFGLKKYNLKKDFNEKEKIKDKILSKEKERIEWLEIENVGTKYIINVEERKKNRKEEQNNPQDIVAKKDALITNIDASYGEVLKKKNDYVRKGETIISGVIKNKEDPVAKVRASGKVYGEIWYKVIVELPKHYYEEKYTSREKKVFKITFFNSDFSLFNFKEYRNYNTSEFNIVKNSYLPIKLTLDTQKEIEIIDEYYNIENCDKKAISLAEKSIKRKLDSDGEIISKKILKKTNKNSKIIIEVFFKVKEDITDMKDISDLNIDTDINQEE